MPAAAHVFLADLDHPELAPADEHHLSRVLRLRDGEVLTGADGQGGWRVFRFRFRTGSRAAPAGSRAAVEGQSPVVLEPAGSRQACPRQVPLLTVGFALTKGDRPEWTVQKLTELGVDRIVPLVSERCVVRWDRDKAARNLDRLRQVARQAATQSRQAWLPEISPMATFAELTVATFAELTVASFAELTAASFADIPVGSAGRDHVSQTAPAGVAARLGLAVPGGGPLTEELTGLLVGPEGGWSDAEERAGLPRVGLGPTILRAETAAVAAGVLLTARRAGLVTTSAGPSSNSGPASVPSPTVGK